MKNLFFLIFSFKGRNPRLSELITSKPLGFSRMKNKTGRLFLFIATVLFSLSLSAQPRKGYYMYPAIHGNEIIFTSEGDLWEVGIGGGTATRLTTGQGMEAYASVSPDGKIIAFSATYEGPAEVYTMPVTGGIPTRRTYDGVADLVVGWTPDGKIIYATSRYSPADNTRLCTLDINTNLSKLIPLAQAWNGVYNQSANTFYFTRYTPQSSHTKRYKGGTAQSIWKFVTGSSEAVPLTSDFTGTSKDPMLWKGRIYFLSDRGPEGTMNVWSMDENGKDLKQETHNVGFSSKHLALDNGKIVYQCGADIHLYDVATQKDGIVPITLPSDFNQEMTTWVKKPMDYLTSVNISPKGDRVALTARGQVFVAPVKQGRMVQVTRQSGVRYRNAAFMPDGDNLVLQSDESGEVEFWKYPSNGVGTGLQLTHDGKGFRFGGIPSPDGKLVVYTDKDNRLLVYSVAAKKTSVIDSSAYDAFSGMGWSPDSKWLAYVSTAANSFMQIMIYNFPENKKTALTDDRVNSYNPAWDPQGKWLYFLSDRTFNSSVGEPWGPYQPEPYFDKTTNMYAVALQKGERFPFAPDNELDTSVDKTAGNKMNKTPGEKKDTLKSKDLKIDLDGIQTRISQVPVPSGNYGNLTMNNKSLFFMNRDAAGKPQLDALSIDNKNISVKTIVPDITSYSLSDNGEKIMFRKGPGIYVIPAAAMPVTNVTKDIVDLSHWTFSFDPKEEWKQMFTEAWRLERDYFYDPNLQGVNYDKMYQMYSPVVSRVRTRDELNDLIAEIVSELSALHTFVRGGDMRTSDQKIQVGSLGAILTKDEKARGYEIEHIYKSEPDYIGDLSPLLRQGVNVKEGDILLSINGVPVLSVTSPDELLENQVGQQVLLHLKSQSTGKDYDAVVVPVSQAAAANLRYDEWEYTRRLTVDNESDNEIGYVHLRAMGSPNITEWTKQFYPVFNRKGLIIDMRYNRGGNIDSWILEKLLRKAWMYFKPRAGKPLWNMQYAFRGHIVVLCNEFTASDGEAFTEGFKKLDLGKVIGTRTWGGEIWLSLDNYLKDHGIASAAEMGVYGPEGKWLVEGHGVDPDIVVDNTPHETFEGKDAQLQAAISFLKKDIKEHPVTVPPPPAYPNKSVQYNR